jgi:hypothetical protein
MTSENQIRVSRFLEWWQCRNPAPLVLSYARVPFPIGGLDVDIPPDQILERKLQNLEVERQIPNDILLTLRVEYSMGFLPALCGAGFDYNADTSWAIPCWDSIKDVKIPPFSDTHPLMQAYLARWEPILKHWHWDTYLPGMITMFGAGDLLSGLIGPTRLAEEIYDNPEYVKGKALEAAHWMRDFASYEIRRRRQAGLVGGTPSAFRHWLPGDGFLISEDFTALIGGRTYREFFSPADQHLTEGFDACFFHIHTVGDQVLSSVLAAPFFQGMEISNDVNNRDLPRFMRGAQAIQARGYPIQVSNWEHPLPREEMQTLLAVLDPRGLLVGFTSKNLAEAREIYAWVKEFYQCKDDVRITAKP